jgi:hypothetical protein
LLSAVQICQTKKPGHVTERKAPSGVVLSFLDQTSRLDDINIVVKNIVVKNIVVKNIVVKNIVVKILL